MRLSIVLCIARNRPQMPSRVPFQAPRLELRLKSRVSRIMGTRAYPCIQETQNLITKLAENEFTGKFCEREYGNLKKSNEEHHANAQAEKARNRSKVFELGREMSFTGTCRYLKKFTPPRRNPFEKPL